MRRRKDRSSSVLAFSHAPPPSCHSLKIFPVSLNPWSVSQDYSASPGFSHPLYSPPGLERGQREAKGKLPCGPGALTLPGPAGGRSAGAIQLPVPSLTARARREDALDGDDDRSGNTQRLGTGRSAADLRLTKAHF